MAHSYKTCYYLGIIFSRHMDLYQHGTDLPWLDEEEAKKRISRSEKNRLKRLTNKKQVDLKKA